MQWIQACLCSFIFRCLVGTDEPSRHMPLTFPPPSLPSPGLCGAGWVGFPYYGVFFWGWSPKLFWIYSPKKRNCKNPFLVEGLFGWLGPGVAFAVCHLRPWAGFRACSRRLPFAVGAYAWLGPVFQASWGLAALPFIGFPILFCCPGCQVAWLSSASGLGLFLFGSTLWVKLSRGLVGLASAEGRCPGDCQLASPIHLERFFSCGVRRWSCGTS